MRRGPDEDGQARGRAPLVDSPVKPGGQTDPVGRDARFARWARRVAGVVVIVLWAAHALLSLVGGLQMVNHSQAVEDLSSGRMTSYALVEERPGQASSSTWWWTGQDLRPASVDELQTGTPAVVYTVAGSRPRLVVPDRIVPSTNSWGSWTEAEVDWIQEDLVTSGLPSTVASVVPGRVGQAHGLLGLVLAVSMLVHVVFGRAPVHGTRWFWFWLIGLPAGLGVLAYAIWEEGGWRDHRAPAPQQRSSGGYGFAILLLGSFVLTAGSQLLTWLLGVTVIPL
ncbi:hypothetical protein [uncultured Serinicoccus sp.]|uniref:hypothetical protein n=1 Tax=uncultured Serinicoccus sp. TaxID=735514 RepID=UPI002637A6CA|nr:hypothetical protein [uncultured Serinicoccus sp.]